MTEPIHKGKMIVWKDDRGFGFIEPENGGRSVFIHVSALKKMPRRPAVGDLIQYHFSTDRQGRPKAVNAVIEGVEPASNRRGGKKSRRGLGRTFFVLLIIISFLLCLNLSEGRDLLGKVVAFVEEIYESIDTTREARDIGKSEVDAVEYECLGKTRCFEMTSCEEAIFYLHNCPGVEIDGDGDGVPCEDQLCGR